MQSPRDILDSNLKHKMEKVRCVFLMITNIAINKINKMHRVAMFINKSFSFSRSRSSSKFAVACRN